MAGQDPTRRPFYLQAQREIIQIESEDELLEQARKAVAFGDVSRAIDRYRAYNEARPWDESTRLELGRLLLSEERHSEAVRVLREIGRSSLDPDVFFQLGAGYLELGQNADAVEALERSLDLEDRPETRRYLGIARGRAGR